LSTPLAGGARAILQIACLSSPLSNSAPVLRGALCTSSLVREASPARRYYADLRCHGARRLLQQRTLVAQSTTSVMFLGPHVGAQYPCTCPLSYKRGGMQCYKGRPHSDGLNLDSQLSSFHSNPTHSGVGYYAPAARTTLKLSRVLVFGHRLVGQAKRLSPFLILGLRAGALRHPVREFSLRQHPTEGRHRALESYQMGPRPANHLRERWGASPNH
jgi:hypothetical protein